jgi:hypothetical protein
MRNHYFISVNLTERRIPLGKKMEINDSDLEINVCPRCNRA